MSERTWRLMAKRLNDRADDYLEAVPEDPDYATNDEWKRCERAHEALCKALAAYRNMAGRAPGSETS